MLGPQAGSPQPLATANDFLPSLQQSDAKVLGNLPNPLSNSGSTFNSDNGGFWNGVKQVGEGLLGDLGNLTFSTPGMMAADVVNSTKNADPNAGFWGNFAQGAENTLSDLYNIFAHPADNIQQQRISQAMGESPYLAQQWYAPSRLTNIALGSVSPLAIGGAAKSLNELIAPTQGFTSDLVNQLPKSQNVQADFGNWPTAGEERQIPLSQQPFNVLSQPPKFDMNFGSVPKTNLADQLPTMDNINHIADSILNPSSVNIPKPTAYQQEFNQALQDELNRLKDIRNNPPGMLDKGGLIRDESPLQGGNILGSFNSTSGNPQWYRDFYAQFGRKPTNNELISIAKDNLLNGEKDSMFGDMPAWKPQSAQELEDNINQIQDIMKFEKDPQTLESLGSTLDQLAQEHDKIMEQAMNEIKGGTNEAAIAEQLPKEEPARTFVMNANAAKEIPREPIQMPKQPVEVPQPFTSGIWEGKVGQPIKNVLSGIGSKLNDVPGLSKLWNNGIVDQLGKNFVKFYGASPETKSILNDISAAKNSDLQNIIGEMRQQASSHGLTNNEMEQLIHGRQGISEITNPKVTNALKDWVDTLENGIHAPEDFKNGKPQQERVLGTNAELNTTFKDKPLLSELRPNYYPQRYNEGIADKLFKPTSGNSKVFSVKGPSNKQRVFDTVIDAQRAGFKPEMNPYVALGQRLAESSQKIRNAQALNKLMDSGIVSKEAKPNMIETSIPQLSGLNIRPEDEEALRSFFGDRSPGEITKLFDKANSLWKKATVYNPMVHGHNILYNGMYLGGANPSYTMNTLRNLAKGQSDEWYQRALRAGAISADRGAFLDNLRSAVKGVSNPIKDKIAYALHGVLWDVDKALRTSIFRQAIENGATDAQAAARANKFLIDYNNLTPFEERYMTRLFPFYRWMKGNLPLQVEQWISNTPKQGLYLFAKAQAARALTGQPLNQDGKFDAETLSNGDHVMVDPYSPADDPGKLLKEGTLPYLYGKLNPILKEGIDQFSNHAYYPFATVAPNGKESMANTTIRNDQAPWTYNAEKTGIHAINSLLPTSGVLGSLAGWGLSALTGSPDESGRYDVNQPKNIPHITPTEAITKALGGFTSRDNPLKDQYYQQKKQQDDMQKHISYEQQNGIPVPKSEYKEAHKKIKYPIAQ